jgi:hypothetical protein
MNLYKTKKINSVNTLTCEIEQTFTGDYSILIYDEEGDIFLEQFAKSYDEATPIADKLFENILTIY